VKMRFSLGKRPIPRRMRSVRAGCLVLSFAVLFLFGSRNAVRRRVYGVLLVLLSAMGGGISRGIQLVFLDVCFFLL
jgi:hypothetical protein